MFRLHKWYLDVVTDTGDVLILYAGTVEWGRIAFDYASVLQYRDGVTRDVQSVRRVAQPRLQADAVTWRSGPLRVEGQWIRDAQEIQRTLVNGPDGLINWTCHMPRAQATVQFHGGEDCRTWLRREPHPQHPTVETSVSHAAMGTALVGSALDRVDWLDGLRRSALDLDGR